MDSDLRRNIEDDFLDSTLVEDQSLKSTVAPVSIAMTVSEVSSTTTITTIAIVSIVILLAIIAVFAMGIFIDYRQEKINGQKLEEVNQRRRRKRLTLPMCRRSRDSDTSHIVDNFEGPGRSRPPLETIMEVV